MLILGLRLHEEIVIEVPPSAEPQRIVVRLSDISRWAAECPWRVKLGFSAARSIPIHRRRVLERIEAREGA